MNGFQDTAAVVTGAGSGIGRALAMALGARGARVAISDVNADNLERTAELLRSRGTEVHAHRLDVADRAAFAAYADEVLGAFGQVHRLFNNAGIGAPATTLVETPFEVLDKVLAVNLGGVINGTKAFLPHLIESGDGHLINISSLNGLMGQPRLVAYCTSKFAVRGFTEAVRAEMIRGGLPVKVTVVHPGGVRTAIADVPVDATRSEQDGKHAEVYAAKLFKMTAEDAADRILRAVAGGRGRLRLGQAVMVDRLVRLVPESYPRIVSAWDRRTFGER